MFAGSEIVGNWLVVIGILALLGLNLVLLGVVYKLVIVCEEIKNVCNGMREESRKKKKIEVRYVDDS